MAEITPRWEWRSFGARFGQAEKRLAAFTPSGVQESDEVYLLSGAGDNVKVRDALMDIKVLREVNADALEQWTPVMKAGFPLPAAEATKVLEALGLPIPTPIRASHTLDEFIGQFAAPGGAIRAVKVHKRRTRYKVGGCMAELSDVVANGKPTRTIAVESEDAAGVMRAVRELGLGGYTNTSYPRGLAALIDRQIELYRSQDADARRAIVGLQPKRAEVILAGACIVRTVMEKLGKQSFTRMPSWWSRQSVIATSRSLTCRVRRRSRTACRSPVWAASEAGHYDPMRQIPATDKRVITVAEIAAMAPQDRYRDRDRGVALRIDALIAELGLLAERCRRQSLSITVPVGRTAKRRTR